MFGKQKRMSKNEENRITIFAPLNGETIKLSQVDDPAFSEGLLGNGIAIRPSGNRVVSPVKGTVTQMFDTSHAVVITSEDGAEVLIHIGMDTVKLKGEHFTQHARSGDAVEPGSLLLEFDREAIESAGYDTVSPVVICNSDDFGDFETETGISVSEGDAIIHINKK